MNDDNKHNWEPGMPKTKEEVARALGTIHFAIEPAISQIFILREKPEIEALPETPIKLLEVNSETPPSGVIPIHFGPSPKRGIDFPSIIVEVTPQEYEAIKSNAIPLPEGWEIAEEIQKARG